MGICRFDGSALNVTYIGHLNYLHVNISLWIVHLHDTLIFFIKRTLIQVEFASTANKDKN